MALTDAPRIQIGSTVVSNAWTLAERIGIDGVRLTWGRKAHTDRAVPAQAYFELIDTDGHLDGYASLIGEPVIISRGPAADGSRRVIFRGRVTHYGVEVIHLTDPNLFYRRRAWRLSVSASDKLADLSRVVLAGPGGPLVPALGPGYWPSGSAEQRLTDVQNQGARDIVTGGVDWAPLPDGDPGVRVATWAEAKTALEIIENVYAGHALGYALFDAHTNTVHIGTPAISAGLALTWAGGILSITVPSGGQAIPASRVAVPNGYKATTGIDEAIDIVLAHSGGTVIADDGSGGFTVSQYENVVEHAVAGYDMIAGGRREHRIATDFFTAPDRPDAGAAVYEYPFPMSVMNSPYGWRESTNSFHAGLDFSYPDIGGAAIHPVGPGVVVEKTTLHSGWGNTIVIDHGDGLSSRYAHMVDPSTLAIGETVTRDSVLGYVGTTGNSSGNHLHLETYVNGAHIDPQIWMADRQSATPPAPEPADDSKLAAIAARTAAALGQLTGKTVMPPLRLDWRHFEYSQTVTDAFIDTKTSRVPLYFPGSVFATMLDAAAVHQIIGGTLVFAEGGWTLDATVAPALGHGEGVTVAGLVTRDEPTIADFSDDITLADLGNITIGATA
ncbi:MULTISPECIES: M23 family metallopeptidase [unclassified Microbacterium]|uniref:M23 family metallopeptidase n=1 Tax=unclassified Microbacterium TaxID=2609290 RepID=UPI003466448B